MEAASAAEQQLGLDVLVAVGRLRSRPAHGRLPVADLAHPSPTSP